MTNTEERAMPWRRETDSDESTTSTTSNDSNND